MIKNQTQIEYKINGKRLEISVVGEIDHHSCAKLRSEADELIKNNKTPVVALNLSGVGFMDSSGLGFIMGRCALVKRLGGELILKSPNESVKKICRLAGLERIVKIEK